MDKNVQDMSSSELLQEFVDRTRAGQYGDLRVQSLEAEILRRMAW